MVVLLLLLMRRDGGGESRGGKGSIDREEKMEVGHGDVRKDFEKVRGFVSSHGLRVEKLMGWIL
jgi:hypothetical protein